VERWPKYTPLRPFINLKKSKIKIISLFPETSYKKRIHVLPNRGPNIVFENDGLNKVSIWCTEGGVRDPCICNLCSKCNGHNASCKMISATIGEATHIISKRSGYDVNNMNENFSQIQEALKENKSNLSKLENITEESFENYRKKFDGIERKLEHDKIQSKNKGSQKTKLNATTSHDM